MRDGFWNVASEIMRCRLMQVDAEKIKFVAKTVLLTLATMISMMLREDLETLTVKVFLQV